MAGTLRLFSHPFSSYCQKALIALFDNGTAFEPVMLSPENPDGMAELRRRWPVGKFPLLVDGDRSVFEATSIVEHLDLHHPGPVRLIPENPDAALETRMMDRVFDNYVSNPQARIVTDALRKQGDRDPVGVAEARGALDTIYGWLDSRMADRTWAAGERFTLADCAAAPALFYADWTHPIGEKLAALKAYRARLLARPSVARAVDEARPFRHLFPLGAPDRD